jgi:hypothetical protein
MVHRWICPGNSGNNSKTSSVKRNRDNIVERDDRHNGKNKEEIAEGDVLKHNVRFKTISILEYGWNVPGNQAYAWTSRESCSAGMNPADDGKYNLRSQKFSDRQTYSRRK